MSKWINNTKPIHTWGMEKLCHLLDYCPYGQLIEEYPIQENESDLSCEVFGHDCPVYYQAENICE